MKKLVVLLIMSMLFGCTKEMEQEGNLVCTRSGALDGIENWIELNFYYKNYEIYKQVNITTFQASTQQGYQQLKELVKNVEEKASQVYGSIPGVTYQMNMDDAQKTIKEEIHLPIKDMKEEDLKKVIFSNVEDIKDVKKIKKELEKQNYSCQIK